MQKSTVIKLGVALVAVVFAVWWYRAHAAGDEIPDDKTSTSIFMCSDCKFVEELTDRQYDNRKQATMLAQQQQASNGQAAVPRAGRAAGVLRILQCSKCKHFTAHAARKCPNDGEVFIDRADDGSPNKCPKCGWVAGTPPGVPKKD